MNLSALFEADHDYAENNENGEKSENELEESIHLSDSKAEDINNEIEILNSPIKNFPENYLKSNKTNKNNNNLTVPVNGKTKTLRKYFLCWLLSSKACFSPANSKKKLKRQTYNGKVHSHLRVQHPKMKLSLTTSKARRVITDIYKNKAFTFK